MGIVLDKDMDEERQGEALSMNDKEEGKKLFLESYGCAMNFSDSEVVASILIDQGYVTTQDSNEADVVLINTCSIRENAEQRIRNRLTQFNKAKKQKPGMVIGILGCMAERLKTNLLEEEKLVDLVAGPDSYRDLPGLIEAVDGGQKAVNVLLSRDETYADISPVRLDKNGVTGFVSITRGCDNMCSFCVVPFTRGRERSRDPHTIVQECAALYNAGYREVTLLGQNVDSYRWNMTSKGEIKDETKPTTNFAQLLEMVAGVHPKLRVRFSTSHPKDMTDDVLHAIAKHKNVCNYIHLPVQSGNSDVLKRMNRGYTREWYMNRIDAIKRIIPDCGISTDIITGFCDETEEQHQDTLSIMKEVRYDSAYMYKYSERPKTLAERKYEDNVPEDVKQRRLEEVIELQHKHSLAINNKQIGEIQEVLIEKESRRSSEQLMGRTDKNHKVIFDKKDAKIGDYVMVKITAANKASLKGEIVEV
ncbi:tRNA (N6-isopentenyl adenosine(37)-C2)-methylthiotransferase MiaB [Brumimicrobium salinarum]|uniref:tRNA-2-methylthio-N(6)-dimethylallyladenosine synthase n=1 Tax=Brumimicrobium salinarum TaxID=2058658 RepID=A0A2I0R1T6_9FLAO|nr:tRNA (N6-isopentenyl adenosine(37)-C2)-methylthiotransferase MiaB [Brumimicrobium salinarum]PKR80551.1 tRNA (N6-isopentenyl adenosine(37)-C2)-methylthiotransferase MiaB [Brumimicrobium salinarum]